MGADFYEKMPCAEVISLFPEMFAAIMSMHYSRGITKGY